jgi:hypothetical protein
VTVARFGSVGELFSLMVHQDQSPTLEPDVVVELHSNAAFCSSTTWDHWCTAPGTRQKRVARSSKPLPGRKASHWGAPGICDVDRDPLSTPHRGSRSTWAQLVAGKGSPGENLTASADFEDCSTPARCRGNFRSRLIACDSAS